MPSRPVLASLSLFVTAATGMSAAKQADSNPQLELAWATEPVLEIPEAVFYDSERERIYVSNIGGSEPGDGFISILDLEGRILNPRFATGLNDPKGLGRFDKQLYVADVDRIVVISIESGEILNTYPVKGARFLNDIAIDAFGIIYCSDTLTNKVHKIENGYLRTAAESDAFGRPNGLYVVNPVTLLMATSQGHEVGELIIGEARLESWAGGIAGADDIARDAMGAFYVSAFEGIVYRLQPGGEKMPVLDTRDAGMNAAGLDFVPGLNLLLVATFHDNRVVAYRIRN